ncbi:heparan-alpha-glucosaminide N-acetyltransferase-like isoform X2 [Hibiscus syriacus]|uniref:heparan-alpha-glucosaminide N-acetyltransferase-like isoform X2 n=1 Tax=Hibiscus syriacus TaxID=106335 RepID=UPI00192148E0|nr:heparan-alpha-glucosaminide N-acetyltransferase-like isoform X2 [Hibiscus syriacus]
MSTQIATEEQGRQPLLYSTPTNGNEEEIVISSYSNGSDALNVNSKQRLLSLDIFRGLTVALMILVDDAGGAFPSINHAPWFGVTIADFVMPFFLFGVGVSISLVFEKASSKPLATKKDVFRTAKCFLLGLCLQGGYFHGRNNLTYGVDVAKIRWLGVLQRISIGYLLASMTEIWLVKNITVDSPIAFVRKYYVQWVVATLLLSFYMCLLYGLYVPNWEFQAPSLTLSTNVPQIVRCGIRGSLEPPCNAVGYIDRYFLGDQHLYQRPVYRRTKECSVNSPDYGPLPPHSPEWCLAPFDPEGILSSLMAVLTCFVGLHFGHILLHYKMHRVVLWSISSFTLLIFGFGLQVLGIPFSKPLYTLSYMCITAGASGLFLTIIFYMADVKHFRKPVVLLQRMGMNALIIYALAACDIFPAAVQGFYWRSPENNLVDGVESLLQAILHSRKWGTFVFVLLEILFWCLVGGFLHMKGVYIKQ